MDVGLRRAALLLLLTLTVASGQQQASAKESSDTEEEPRLVCYYSNWAVYRPGLAKFTPENINPYLCTHLIYAFAALSEDFRLQPFDPYNDIEQGNYRSFVGLKSHNPGLKTLVAVGGWNEGSRRFSRLVESREGRGRFVSSAITFLREHGFDGIDLDWEYPAFREGGNHTTDKKGYALLVKELRQAIEEEKVTQSEREKLLLTVAVPATKEYIDGGFDVPQIAKYADFLNLLTYDYHSAYEVEAQHHAQLFPRPGIDSQDEENQLNVAWTVNYYLSLGAPSRKLVVGIPLYGRSYTLSAPRLDHGFGAPADAPGEEGAATREKGYLAYYEICQKVKDDDWEVETPSPDQVGPYAHKGNQWVGFDDEEMLLNKARFIVDNKLGGAMIWTLDNDDFRGLCTDEPSPLVSTVRDALLGSNLIAGSSSLRSVARSAGAGPQARSSALQFDDEAASEPEEDVAEAPPKRGRNTLRRLVQNRQAARNRQAAGRRINTDAEENAVVTTPSPPPTPDPGVGGFECQDEGFFNNPRDCKKYFWCLDSGPANLGVVAHAFTCPSGLHFNSGSESCDYPDNVVCPVGSLGASPAKTTSRPRARATTSKTTTSTTTTTTTTEAPTTTTTEEPKHVEESAPRESTSDGGENVAELLRLLQAIGGVERLQSILGAQEQASSDKEAVTPHRSTPEAVSDSTPPRHRPPQHDTSSPYLDPYDFVRPEVTLEELDEDDADDFRFQYNTPSRGMTPGVSYVSEDEGEVSPYEAPLRSATSATAAPATTKEPYRTPIRVQVGRVVRVHNGTTLGNGVETTQGGRRRMLVRVRPAGSGRAAEDVGPKPTAEGPQVTGRAVNGDERRLSGSSLLATRANPSGSSGETRVAVRRRPVYNNDRGAPQEEQTAAGQAGVRLVARRPNDVVTVRRRPSQATTPAATTTTVPTTTTTTTTTTPAPATTLEEKGATEDEDYYEYYDDEEEYEDEATTKSTTTTTTTSTTKKPTNVRPSSSSRRRPGTSRPATLLVVTTTSTTPRPSRRGLGPQSSTAAPLPSAIAAPENDDGPPVEVLSDSEVTCHKRGVFIHPTECSKFIACAPASRNADHGLKGRVLNCPANQIYLVDIGRCMKGDRNQCRKL